MVINIILLMGDVKFVFYLTFVSFGIQLCLMFEFIYLTKNYEKLKKEEITMNWFGTTLTHIWRVQFLYVLVGTTLLII
jgi:hypothetical protein